MDELKSLIEKRQTHETPEKWQNSSNAQQTLSPRQMAIAALINQTQTRRGLPLISVGSELTFQLRSWGEALKNVPDAYLSRSYSRAAENWPWTEKPFTVDAVVDAFKVLFVEDRQRNEAELRNAAKQNPDTFRCYHCQDIGYQPFWNFRMQRWYCAQRACICEAAPIGERNQMALEEPEFIRGKLDEWVRVADLEAHGAPSKAFDKFIAGKEGEK